jgi:hypothetical protein
VDETPKPAPAPAPSPAPERERVTFRVYAHNLGPKGFATANALRTHLGLSLRQLDTMYDRADLDKALAVVKGG